MQLALEIESMESEYECARGVNHSVLCHQTKLTHDYFCVLYLQITREETMQWFVKKFEGILNTGKPVHQSNYRARKGKKK